MNKLIVFSAVRRLLDSRGLSVKITADGKEVSKKKVFENRITLIGPDNTLSITDLKNAQSLSLRRELKLVKIQDEDSKTRRPVYKLMTNAQYHEEELTTRKEKQEKRITGLKGQKLLTLSSKIADHDVMVTVNKIKKLIDKQYEVKVIISGSEEDSERFEKIYTMMEKKLCTNGKVLQKRDKGTSLKFHIVPLKDSSAKTGNDSSDSEKEKGPL